MNTSTLFGVSAVFSNLRWRVLRRQNNCLPGYITGRHPQVGCCVFRFERVNHCMLFANEQCQLQPLIILLFQYAMTWACGFWIVLITENGMVVLRTMLTSDINFVMKCEPLCSYIGFLYYLKTLRAIITLIRIYNMQKFNLKWSRLSCHLTKNSV